MATWTTVPDASLEPGKPIRSIDALALRDNPVAIAEGASGAPKVRTAALQPPVAGDGFLISRILEQTKSNSNANPINSYLSTELQNYKYHDAGSQISFVVLVPGTIRLKYSHSNISSVAISYVRVLKNSTQISETSVSGTTFVEKTTDISVATGDVITLQQRSSSSFASLWTNVRVYSATPDMAVA